LVTTLTGISAGIFSLEKVEEAKALIRVRIIDFILRVSLVMANFRPKKQLLEG